MLTKIETEGMKIRVTRVGRMVHVSVLDDKDQEVTRLELGAKNAASLGRSLMVTSLVILSGEDDDEPEEN